MKKMFLFLILLQFQLSAVSQSLTDKFTQFANAYESELVCSHVSQDNRVFTGGKYGYWGYFSELNTIDSKKNWELIFESTLSAYCNGITSDNEGNVYALIGFKRDIKFSNIQLKKQGGLESSILVKIKKTGDYTENDYILFENVRPEAISYNTSTGIVAGFVFRHEINFMNKFQFKGSLDEIILASFKTTNWELNWAKLYSGNGDNYISALHISTDGTIYMAGGAVKTINFGNVTTEIQNLNPHNTFCGFLTEINQNGDVKWSRLIPQMKGLEIKSIQLDKNNQLIIGGTFGKAYDFAGNKIEDAGEKIPFIHSLNDQATKTNWFIMGSTKHSVEFNNMKLIGDKMYVVGTFFRTLKVLDKEISTGDSDDAFKLIRNAYLMEYDVTQKSIQLKRYHSQQDVRLHAVDFNSSNVLIFGDLHGNLLINNKEVFKPLGRERNAFLQIQKLLP